MLLIGQHKPILISDWLQGSNCVLVSSHSSVSVNHPDQLMSVNRPDQSRESAVPRTSSTHQTEAGDSLNKLNHDLAVLVEQAKNTSLEPKKKTHKKVKKKISLPIRLTDERHFSTLPTDSRSKSERKRSVDSTLSKLSPTLSPDMKVNTRF